MKNIKENLRFGKNYALPLLIYNSVFFILFYFLDGHSTIILTAVFGLVIITYFGLLNYLGWRRKKEINSITETIRKIRNNQLMDHYDIQLGSGLKILEEEIREMYRSNKEVIENLKKMEKVRTEFLGNVSHELRTPIFAIQGFIETLLDGAVNDPNVNITFLQKANRHLNNLNNLLNDLIDISMIESGQMKMNLRYFDLEPVLINLYNEFKPFAENKNLNLELKLKRPIPEVYGDKDKIRLVLSNLIVNAIKYTEEGKVEVGLQDYEKEARIYVRDTGIGISPEDQRRIFERFYRVDKNRSRELGGTGLGLAIVKHIIEAHNSRMELISKPGEGSEFAFRLRKFIR
ncbi:sensor histidine kinase [Melioribacter sp. Ez-97]|uniref:sensor histidine kinase n=1 Tax=Melioribacter sp. Ez-97 TaxID=3423434 RepID=UPI003EDA07BB